MMVSEFLELLYYHIIYSMDTGLISIVLIIATIELIRIRRSLEELTREKKDKTNKRNRHFEIKHKTDIQNE